MLRPLRLGVLVLALLFAAPVVGPAAAHAESGPAATTDIHIPKPIWDWIKKNAMGLYIVFDEIMDDVFGGCDGPTPPPPPPQPPAPDPTAPY